MKSMTGFGRGERATGGVRVTVEIGTVNRRNAELIFNLPRELAPCEPALRDLLAPAIARGRATVTASVSAGKTPRPLVDRILFRRLHAELSDLHRSLRLPGSPSFSDTVRLYAAAAREESTAAAPDTAAVLSAARAALKALDSMRIREGSHLAAELRRLLASFAREIAAIRKLAPGVTRRHREALRARLDSVAPGLAADDERLARELALVADRSDITEELSRLESHLAQFRSGLDAEAAGRTLDFLAQEMFRECNTIGAKASSADIAHRVVAAKTELERIREQVQNVE
jgi:uncharacterized protein (TIGR00255 family)